MGARGSFRGGFNPASVVGISAWLRLAASTPVSGEYETNVDVLTANNATQVGAVRKPAAAASANGLPVATFDGSDVWVWPLAASNSSTDKWEMLLWLRPANVASAQRLYAADTASGGNLNRFRVNLNGSGGVDVLVFITNANGRTLSTPNSVLTAGAWAFLRVAYDSAGATEADQVKVFIGGVAQSLTGADVGAGGAIGALRTITGNSTIGGANDADAPVSPLINGTLTGPNIWVANATLTTDQATNLQNFEAPT